MRSGSLNMVVQQLRSAERVGGERTDGALLTCFLSERDEDALAALVERHAPMVWGVCRRILHRHHDAEDAFQATFIVLVHKARSVAQREMVGNWLYGVAHQTAVRLRATAAKRGVREMQTEQMPEPEVSEAREDELLSHLDQELSRMPEQYRALIVLCDLEGKTRKEVARQLGCPEGTVASRHARAKSMLAKRLARRGLAVSSWSLATALSHSVASAEQPGSVVAATIKVVTLLAAGKAAGVISGPVTTLTQGVLKTMFIKKILTTAVSVLALGAAIITGGSLAVGQTEGALPPTAGPDAKPSVGEKPVDPASKKEKEAYTAWGKEGGGLQAGMGYRPGEKRAYAHGETVKLVVRVRNVGKEEVKFQYLLQFFVETPASVTDGEGKPVPQIRSEAGGQVHIPVEVNLAPGKEIELYELNLKLRPASEDPGDKLTDFANRLSTIYGTGKFHIQYERAFGLSSLSGRFKLDPTLSKLATGKLELEVKEPEKLPQEKEAFTAWGKEVGGLQAGLGYPLGQKRAYSHGETVKLVVRVRNVGKAAVKFHYYSEDCYEYPPTVVNGDGMPVTFKRPTSFGWVEPIEASLAPGKEVELCKLNLQIRPASEKGKDNPWTLSETGKYQIQYQKVGGNLLSQEIRANPILSKLATGKLELEVKEPEKLPQEKEPAAKQEERNLGKIEPPGGVPLSLVEPGTKTIGVDQLKKVSKRLESVPENVFEQWVVELERIMDAKMNEWLPIPRQACRTDFAVRMSVAFDDLSWNTKAAEKLYKRACTMPTKEATAWKEAFEALLKKKIGIDQTVKDEFANLAGGPPWAVPLVLIPVDALHEGQKYSVERGKKYLARLKQLTKDDISLWSDKVDKFGGTELDAAVNIILLDGFFIEETFKRDKFKAAVERQQG